MFNLVLAVVREVLRALAPKFGRHNKDFILQPPLPPSISWTLTNCSLLLKPPYILLESGSHRKSPVGNV